MSPQEALQWSLMAKREAQYLLDETRALGGPSCPAPRDADGGPGGTARVASARSA